MKRLMLSIAMSGPAFHLPAAMAFFRALRVYPSPVEFIMMLQSTLPEPVFKVRLSATEVQLILIPRHRFSWSWLTRM